MVEEGGRLDAIGRWEVEEEEEPHGERPSHDTFFPNPGSHSAKLLLQSWLKKAWPTKHSCWHLVPLPSVESHFSMSVSSFPFPDSVCIAWRSVPRKVSSRALEGSWLNKDSYILQDKMSFSDHLVTA